MIDLSLYIVLTTKLASDAHLRHAEHDAAAAPVEQVGRRLDQRRGADALEHVVDAVRADLLDRLDQVDVGPGGDEVGRAELPGERLLGRVGVDRDDRQRVGQRQALDHVEADAADADDHGRLAVGHLGPVEHRARRR